MSFFAKFVSEESSCEEVKARGSKSWGEGYRLGLYVIGTAVCGSCSVIVG